MVKRDAKGERQTENRVWEEVRERRGETGRWRSVTGKDRMRDRN